MYKYPIVLWSPLSYHVLWEADCNIRTTCESALSTSTYTDDWIGNPLPCQNASWVVCIASFSKTYVDLVACIAEASWKMNICWSIVRVAKFSPLNSKPCGVITCLTKAENNKPWRPVVRPNRYGWIWIAANTVFIVFGGTTRVWNNRPLNRFNGRKTSWKTNAASGVCINHHPRNCKSRGIITC